MCTRRSEDAREAEQQRRRDKAARAKVVFCEGLAVQVEERQAARAVTAAAQRAAAAAAEAVAEARLGRIGGMGSVKECGAELHACCLGLPDCL